MNKSTLHKLLSNKKIKVIKPLKKITFFKYFKIKPFGTKLNVYSTQKKNLKVSYLILYLNLYFFFQLQKFSAFMNSEPDRQVLLKEWRDKWREKFGGRKVIKKEYQAQRRKEEEEKLKQEEARKKYNEEVYK